jgi:hypothetical protein
MPYRDDDDDADLDDSEYPEPDPEDEDRVETVPCPYCRRPVYEDAERCPECGNYLSREDVPARHPPWLVLGAIVCLLIVLGWVLGH